jgi:hypothetical protein
MMKMPLPIKKPLPHGRGSERNGVSPEALPLSGMGLVQAVQADSALREVQGLEKAIAI